MGLTLTVANRPRDRPETFKFDVHPSNYIYIIQDNTIFRKVTGLGYYGYRWAGSLKSHDAISWDGSPGSEPYAMERSRMYLLRFMR